MRQINHAQRAQHQLVRRKCRVLQLRVQARAVQETIHFHQHRELQELLVRQMVVDHPVRQFAPEIIHTDLQLLDLHFVLGQEYLSDLVALVRQELQDLRVCAHQWARDLHPNLVTVPHHLHVQPVVPADIPQQQEHLIEVGLRLRLVDPVEQVVVVQEVDQELVVPVADVPVARRADHDKDKNPRKLVVKRSIIYAHHHLVALLFRTAMEALQ